jgi:hypothetical protein
VERLFGVEANEGDDLALEFDRGTGLGKYWARRSGWSFSTTILCGFLLIDRPLGIGGAPGVMEGVDIVVALLSCGQGCDTVARSAITHVSQVQNQSMQCFRRSCGWW